MPALPITARHLHVASDPAEPMRSRREIALAVPAFTLAALVRLAFLGTDWRSPDAVEFYDAARHLAAGAGLTLSVKYHYFTGAQAVHSMLGERPVLYPLFLAVVLRLFGSALAAQAATTILALVEVIFLWLLARRFVAPPYALGAALLCGLAPRSVALGHYLWSETLYATLLLLALLLCTAQPFPARWPLAGVVLGLAALSRTEGYVVAVALLALLGYWRQWGAAGSCLAAFLVLLAPYWILNARSNGNPFYATEAHHLQVRYFADGMWVGFGRHLPTALEFLRQNAGWLAGQMPQRLQQYLEDLVRPGWLGPLGLLVLLPFPAWSREPRLRLLAALGLASLLLYSCPLLADMDSTRFPLTAFLLGVLLAAYNVQWLLQRFSHVRRLLSYGMPCLFLCWLVVLLALDIQDWQAARIAGAGPWGAPALRAAERWLATHTSPESVVAADNAWAIALDADRPAVLRPYRQDAVTLQALEHRYHVRYLLVELPRMMTGVPPLSGAPPTTQALRAAHLRAVFSMQSGGATIIIYMLTPLPGRTTGRIAAV